MLELKNPKKTVDPLKRPPHSLEAEQSIIGGLMLDNQVWDKISTKLCETDFYRTEHRILFRAISALSKKDQPFDVVTLLDTLKSHNELDDAGGEAYLFELANNTPSVANVSAYADIVREKSVQRQLIAVATEMNYFTKHSSVELKIMSTKIVFLVYCLDFQEESTLH